MHSCAIFHGNQSILQLMCSMAFIWQLFRAEQMLGYSNKKSNAMGPRPQEKTDGTSLPGSMVSGLIGGWKEAVGGQRRSPLPWMERGRGPEEDQRRRAR